MPKTIISEGKTTAEAIEKGLKELHTTKDKVEIKVLEEENKRSFFSILAPRVIKVEICMKEEKDTNINKKKERTYQITEEELQKAHENIERFINAFLSSQKLEELVNYEIINKEGIIEVDLNGENISYLIGYRGETLNSLQTIISAVANKGLESKCKVILDIEGYRAKREKTLEELAEKIARTVIKTKKSVTLEPMSAYERKIIHSKLQNSNKVKTYSIGEEPRRKVVISLK